MRGSWTDQRKEGGRKSGLSQGAFLAHDCIRKKDSDTMKLTRTHAQKPPPIFLHCASCIRGMAQSDRLNSFNQQWKFSVTSTYNFNHNVTPNRTCWITVCESIKDSFSLLIHHALLIDANVWVVYNIQVKWNLWICFGSSYLVLSTDLTWYRPCVESTSGSEVSDSSRPHAVQEFGHVTNIYIYHKNIQWFVE